jgi:hypothetical protein
MSEQIDRYCVYGIAIDYDDLHEILRGRATEIGTTREALDAVSGLQSGYSAKLLAPVPIKTLGKISLGPMLQTLGLALVVVRDDAAFDRIKDRLSKSQRPPIMPSIVRIARPAWLFTAEKARESRQIGLQKMSPKQRKKSAKHAARARWSRPRPRASARAGS